MKNIWKRTLACLLAAVLLIPQSIATLENYNVAITRTRFRELAMNFVAVQEHSDLNSLEDLTERYLKTDGVSEKHFVDARYNDSLAYDLGLVVGRGNGHFDPQGLITRQEAAVMLTRAYKVIGGQLPQDAASAMFEDQANIADWAKASAGILTDWKVMQGTEDNRFAPQENYSIEQYIVTLLRLYQNAPVSRKQGNITELFSYGQCIARFEEHIATWRLQKPNLIIYDQRVDGAKATFVESNINCFGWGETCTYFFYRDGSVKLFDMGLSNMSYPIFFRLENCHFSKDGGPFSCKAILPSDVVRSDGKDSLVILYEAGTYSITIDVDTCQYQIGKTA